MRLTLQPTPEQVSALSDTRTHVSRLMNTLLVQARRNPDTPTDDLLTTHPDAPALPHATRRAAAQAAHDARHNTRGGLKGESYWLDARSLRINPVTGHVTLWTLSGRHTIPTRLGNYQRHLLTTGRVQGGRVTQARNGDWYVNVQLDSPATTPATPKRDPLATRIDQLEREGKYDDIVRLLRRRTLDSKRTGQFALSLLETGETDAAEICLLRAAGDPVSDARIHLGLSLLAAMRSGPEARLTHARRGLDAQPDEVTRWWLICSQARALVELGSASEAQRLMADVLDEIPVSELRSRARALYFTQNVSASMDDFESQDRYAREALRLFDLLGGHSESLSLRMDLGYRLFFEGRPEESLGMIHEVLKRAEQLNDHRRDTTHLILGELYLLQEKFDTALHHLDLSIETQSVQGSDRLNVLARAFRAECLWRTGKIDFNTFERQIDSLNPKQEFDFIAHSFYTGMIQVEHGHVARAIPYFEAVIEGVALMDGFRLRSHAFRTFCRWSTGVSLQEASIELIEVLSRIGGELALAVDTDRLAPLYAAFADHHLGGGAARRLAVRARPTVRIALLGNFTVTVNGTDVQIRLRKSRELLAFLCLQGAATRDQLMTALWDGEARTELGSYFKQALHALRQALRPFLGSQDPLPLTNGVYRLAEKLDIRCDAVALQSWQKPDSSVDRHHLADTYPGAFLPEAETEWAVEMREFLDNQWLALLMAVGSEIEVTDPVAAAHLYLKATHLNPLFESAWSAAIAAYAKAGLSHLSQHTRAAAKRALDS
ncbi:hypothetical protein [Deinococcus soli (ex Cha et al. 2016)]|uniref:DNA-binding SARP family transcriptional activator n=2 Tax=Deinococcus soli (ex Cha et al. 2016) TaxID=1309411 RepID=A0AAE4BNS6_9DEIO|nr:hypothetical protein [Deinococcus soli (ex Cha et al. 2016)]MDR6220280.1 DNA-binding SARP family transcriptional activator [Deinococcus soli (ex Cha et al. 2016)]MDR6330135.1 DNA-binding SARP family transcriptional activator [Deinococcus soli (ex Cha et al. 2016)]MDR6752913.1 DNA-binding SARP family transcriptional activator [Deinococcus soli (ex Cha et al. 2016)]